MGLFRRKAAQDDVFETKRCPYCREPLPDSAEKCVMCGADLPVATPARDAERAAVARRQR